MASKFAAFIIGCILQVTVVCIDLQIELGRAKLITIVRFLSRVVIRAVLRLPTIGILSGPQLTILLTLRFISLGPVLIVFIRATLLVLVMVPTILWFTPL